MSNDQIKTAIAIKLIQYRHDNNLNQEEMAEKFKLSREAYAPYENQKRMPRIKMLRKMKIILELNSIDELIGCNDDVSIVSR